jgi:hypothetical protein
MLAVASASSAISAQVFQLTTLPSVEGFLSRTRYILIPRYYPEVYFSKFFSKKWQKIKISFCNAKKIILSNVCHQVLLISILLFSIIRWTLSNIIRKYQRWALPILLSIFRYSILIGYRKKYRNIGLQKYRKIEYRYRTTKFRLSIVRYYSPFSHKKRNFMRKKASIYVLNPPLPPPRPKRRYTRVAVSAISSSLL